jgi:LPS-assembly protein
MKTAMYIFFLTKRSYRSVFFLSALCCLLAAACCFADEPTVITSETLVYDHSENTYTAQGNVKIERAETVIEADEITYNEQTSGMSASGTIRYHDDDVSITAARAELNLETKTGTIFEAVVLYKKDNYRIAGKEIRKTGNKYFFSPEATFTTCDAPVPAWCFQGRDMDAAVGDRLSARDVVFRLKNVPVLYTPVLWAPILTERKTGFLFPFVGYSDSRGLQVTIPFYWALSENQDATFVIDNYAKRGLGTGMEYRYVWPDTVKGEWWGYHIRDRELSKDFFELRARHDQRSGDGLGGYLNINYVNENDFYREFKTDLQARTNRFLESTGEMAIPFSTSRAYLLSQYWIDLKEGTPDPLQRLPEAGYVLNPTNAGPVWISGSFALSNFWREEGIYGQRMDMFPRITHAFGEDFTVLQSIGLRETAYSLRNSEDNAPHREALEYSISGNLRLLKKFASFTHIMEPSVSYTFVSSSDDSLPVFDSAELLEKVSLIELSLLNRMLNDQGELMVFRISQGFDSYNGDRPFHPLLFNIGIKQPLPLRLGAAYNVHTGDIESLHSDISMKIEDITFHAGQRYNRPNNVNTYVAGIGVHPFPALSMNGGIWYDAEQRETREVSLNLTYMSQCWGITFAYVKRPDDYSISFLIELKGITKALKI